jgi:small subunit ribosomal protein S15
MPKSKKSETILEKPVWLKYTDEEVKAIILKLGNKGMTAEKIGLTLRDQYGIPKVKLYNLKIKRVLNEQDKYQDPDLLNLTSKQNKLINHNKDNKQDKKSHRALILTKAKLKKRQDYSSR